MEPMVLELGLVMTEKGLEWIRVLHVDNFLQSAFLEEWYKCSGHPVDAKDVGCEAFCEIVPE